MAARKYFSDANTPVNWLGGNPETSENISRVDGKTALVLKYYGAVRGGGAKEYGLKDVEDNEYYECIIHTLGCFYVKVVINPNLTVTNVLFMSQATRKTGNGVWLRYCTECVKLNVRSKAVFAV